MENVNQKESNMTDKQQPKTNKPESAQAEQPKVPEVNDEVKENDPVADRVAKHGETPQEEKDAQRDAITGTMRGQDRGPTQSDLNPAYATELVYDPEAGEGDESK